MMYCGLRYFSLLVVVALGLRQSSAFISPPSSATTSSRTKTATKATGSSWNDNGDDRRAFLLQIASASMAVAGSTFAAPPALASGGATAGGAYLLAAKQRYNDRVVKGLQGYLKLESSLKGGSVAEAKAYFDGQELGTWGDISTAGYLLANAFRRSSSSSPDSLPSVKKWKAFVKELDALQKKLKKKDASGSLEAYQSSLAALDGYLAEVDLPPVAELK